MKVFDWYIFRNLAIATGFISVTLALVIFLTQSLRFLELVINSGASSSSFWILTLLALPRFFEVIMPLSLMAGTVFIYNRMNVDSELVVIRSVGYSPLALAKPALFFAFFVTIFLWSVTMWVAPKSLARMQEMRQVIKAQFSTVLFREGVFNQAGKDLTVYIRKRDSKGELYGLMIYDNREAGNHPSTILAKRGILLATDDGYQVLVYDGTRLEYDRKNSVLNRLNFERYTIDLPDSSPVSQRWHPPDERTIFELLTPNPDSSRDIESYREFSLEIHRRFIGPLLAVLFTLISCASLLLGPMDRRGQSGRIAFVIVSTVTLQSLYLAAFSLSRQNDIGLVLMYLFVLVPSCFAGALLGGVGERFRRRFSYRQGASS